MFCTYLSMTITSASDESSLGSKDLAFELNVMSALRMLRTRRNSDARVFCGLRWPEITVAESPSRASTTYSVAYILGMQLLVNSTIFRNRHRKMSALKTTKDNLRRLYRFLPTPVATFLRVAQIPREMPSLVYPEAYNLSSNY